MPTLPNIRRGSSPQVARLCGGGGNGDGRDNNMTVGGGAPSAAASPTPLGGSAADSSLSPATPAAVSNNVQSSNAKEPQKKGFHASDIVFEYGGSEDRFLTTHRAEHVPHRLAGLPTAPPELLSSTGCLGATGTDSQFELNNERLGSRCSSLATISEDALLASATTTPTTADVAAAPSHHNPSTKPQLAGPNELFFGTGAERSSSVSHRDREERLRQLRERQQQERQQKLEELKEHAKDWSEQAAAAQRFREQQEAQRRQRLQELRSRDQDRRVQVEERRRYIEQAEQQRREASIKKNVDRDQRYETKRRNERSNIVFAFGSSTPRMLDPKENQSYWGTRRATSISNVTMGADSSGSSSGNGARRSSDCVDNSTAAAAASGGAVGAPDLARKRATSAQGLDRNPNDLRMSSSMYEVFHWTDHSTGYSPNAPQGTRRHRRSVTKAPRASSPTMSLPPPTPSVSHQPFPLSQSLSSSPVKHSAGPFPRAPQHHSTPIKAASGEALSSSSSSSSSDKTLTPGTGGGAGALNSSSTNSRLSVWEFGDNFLALGPAASQGTVDDSVACGASQTNPETEEHCEVTTSLYQPLTRAATVSVASRNAGGDDLMSRSMTASVARRRTDLHPITPSLRDSTSPSAKPRRRSPGRAVSMSRLDQLAKPRQYPHLLAPLHEKDSERMSSSCSPHSRTRSMTHLAGGRGGCSGRAPSTGETTAKKLNKPLSRSSAALVRSTRAEQLRQQARLTSGGRSGGTTPNTVSSRPTSALSQASSSVPGVALRARTTPRKPRPMSIGGSAPSPADRPRSPSSREGRTAVRNTSSGSLSSVKSTRAKSVGGSDSSAPSTPAKTAPTAPPRTPKRTPAQVKAESNAKKAANSTAAAKRVTSKASPAASPSVETKPLTSASEKASEKKVIEKSKTSDIKDKENSSTLELDANSTALSSTTVSETTVVNETTEIMSIVENGESTPVATSESCEVLVKAEESVPIVTEKSVTTTVVTSSVGDESETKVVSETTTSTVTSSDGAIEVSPVSVVDSASIKETQESTVVVESSSEGESHIAATEDVQVVANAEEAPKEASSEQSDVAVNDENQSENGTGSVPAGERPVAGYATEEEYKAVLAEKRRLAREARERELEMERIRQEEEAARERREEEEMLRLMEEQKKAEEKRLRLAIEQADREREEEIKRKAEEEKQRLEAERLEAERQKEAEEKLRKEEEERQSRKSRVAAIMARTRKAGSLTPNKTESKTPSEDGKTINEVLLKANLTDSMIDKMSDSMIAAATIDSETESCQASSGVSSQPMSEVSSQPNSDVSTSQTVSSDTSSQSTLENSSAVDTSGASSMEQTVRVTEDRSQEGSVDLLSAAVAELAMHQHTNGNALLDNTKAPQSMDLLGSLNGHTNGVDNSNQENQSVDLLGSFDPITSDAALADQNRVFSTNTEVFEQIIDAGQTKLNNEDVMNSNPPADPFIAFEQNLNKKTSENSASVPDILM
ncbi:Microtubule-associated protein 7 family [Trinorchestia longiramus]|nr:Microtubule-associated protein 7 family [Trinorchestia longiramus]